MPIFEWKFSSFQFDFFLPGYTKCFDMSEDTSVMFAVGFTIGEIVQCLMTNLKTVKD